MTPGQRAERERRRAGLVLGPRRRSPKAAGQGGHANEARCDCCPQNAQDGHTFGPSLRCRGCGRAWADVREDPGPCSRPACDRPAQGDTGRRE